MPYLVNHNIDNMRSIILLFNVRMGRHKVHFRQPPAIHHSQAEKVGGRWVGSGVGRRMGMLGVGREGMG